MSDEKYKSQDVFWVLNEIGDPEDKHFELSGYIRFLLTRGFDRNTVLSMTVKHLKVLGYKTKGQFESGS